MNATIKLSAEEREFFAEVDFNDCEVYRLAAELQKQQELYMNMYNKFWDKLIEKYGLDPTKAYEITEDFVVIEDTESEIDF